MGCTGHNLELTNKFGLVEHRMSEAVDHSERQTLENLSFALRLGSEPALSLTKGRTVLDLNLNVPRSVRGERVEP